MTEAEREAQKIEDDWSQSGYFDLAPSSHDCRDQIKEAIQHADHRGHEEGMALSWKKKVPYRNGLLRAADKVENYVAIRIGTTAIEQKKEMVESIRKEANE